jgi:NAD(P)-dependent dehydrogenase (short-subunit alcohol dehydrogenase family)
MKTMNERRVLVTGGSRGLGLGVVQALVAEGAQVTVLAALW